MRAEPKTDQDRSLVVDDPYSLPFEQFRAWSTEQIGHDLFRQRLAITTETEQLRKINQWKIANGYPPLERDLALTEDALDSSARERIRLRREFDEQEKVAQRERRQEVDKHPEGPQQVEENVMAKKGPTSTKAKHEPRVKKERSPKRTAQVLELLKKGEATLEEIAKELKITRNAAHGATYKLVKDGEIKKLKEKGHPQRFALKAA